MVITHNIESLFANNRLAIVNNIKDKSMERLSSGYRINRASDDAAGLTISENMRWQIRGLNKGSDNAKDGISMIQTADGALGDMEDILQRMRELSVQGANDTNTKADRDAIQKEMDALREQIDTISKQTTYNTKNLLYHTNQIVKINSDKYDEVPIDERYNINGGDVWGKALDFSGVNSQNIGRLKNKQFSIDCTLNCAQKFKFEFTDSSSSTIDVSPAGSARPNVTVKIGIGSGSAVENGNDIVNKIKELVSDPASQSAIMNNSGTTPAPGTTYIGHANGLEVNGTKLIMYAVGGRTPSKDAKIHADQLAMGGEEYYLQLSAKEKEGISVTFNSVTSSSLGVDSLSVSDNASAGNAITAIDNAIDTINDYRSYLGAVSNRLEHAYSIADNTSENTQAAESKLRDADMSDEMVDFTKNNILSQAGQSVLAQANQSKQGVLTLLNS